MCKFKTSGLIISNVSDVGIKKTIILLFDVFCDCCLSDSMMEREAKYIHFVLMF